MSSSPPALRIATRRSRLALWQAEHVAARLRAAHTDLEVTLVPMTTQGDRILDRSLATIGGKGLFIKELEVAIAAGRADIAVHSMKDVPGDMPPGMVLAAMLNREDPSDAFISMRHGRFEDLPPNATVGTSSLRRQCQLKALRPDLQLATLRGNVETRLQRLQEGAYDAIILATAGLKRLRLENRITHRFDLERCVPAVGQGVIGIECREDDAHTQALTAALNDTAAWQCCQAERAFAQRLGGSCQSPIGGFAQVENGRLILCGVIGSPDGLEIYRGAASGAPQDARAIGMELAERLLADGAGPLLERLRSDPA
ncbi:hydroxymethylbilane synthase [Steroidobacter denitrificans]|uniref:Porphobilinogen deaminase n=1 Tax=Steroidobacter denitrificans TaxID=465721 RepID=A0A127FD66_STEDE|nr:hydroxymethylbilane synthase [Steroidobacter denitrificans]AMN48334.1 hydroxymethylbilane synthase [Steroidobacter denitrificans]